LTASLVRNGIKEQKALLMLDSMPLNITINVEGQFTRLSARFIGLDSPELTPQIRIIKKHGEQANKKEKNLLSIKVNVRSWLSNEYAIKTNCNLLQQYAVVNDNCI
jgi:hypothetical protein